MYCPRCGYQMPDDARFCPKCGNAVIHSMNNAPKERHRFTSFWLFFLLIGHIFCAFFYLFEHEILSHYWLDMIRSGVVYYPLFAVKLRLPMLVGIYWNQLVLFSVMANIIGIAGLVLLLRWKKIGFLLIVISYIIGLVFGGIFGMIVGSFFGGIIGVAIIYGVLHLRKNSKTAWEQLK